RIGREILIGAAFGGALMLVDLFRQLSPLLIGQPPGVPTLGSKVAALGGLGALYDSWVDVFFNSLETALFFVLMLVAARVIVRRTWLAVIVSLAIEIVIAGGGVPYGGVGWLYYLSQLIALALISLAILRYGVLVTVLSILIDNLPSEVPIIAHGASW